MTRFFNRTLLFRRYSAKPNRPVSPHLTIYQPQLTWYLSIAHRFTGAGVAAGFYAFAYYYAFSSDTAPTKKIANALHSLPAPIFFLLKFIVAAPFSFHTFNGIRHLIWDTGRLLTVEGVYQSGYAVLGASGLSSIVLAAI